MEPNKRFLQCTCFRKTLSKFRAEMQSTERTASDKWQCEASCDGLGLDLVAIDCIRLKLSVQPKSVGRFPPSGMTLFGIARIELNPEAHGLGGHPFDTISLHFWRKIKCDCIPSGSFVLDSGRNAHAVAPVEVDAAP